MARLTGDCVSAGVTIALDAMGGDAGVQVAVPAALAMLDAWPDLRLILVGQQEVISGAMNGAATGSRLSVQDAREIVGMDEPPADALRRKKDSSMRVAINMVKQGEADACVSAGNTGALMATSRFVLKTLPGIDRPAIMAIVPTKRGKTYMLDLGANSACTAEQLFQFAVMGSVFVRDIEDIEHPRVGLLNIGEEDIKGTQTVREAARRLQDSGLNYVGFVEGDAIPDQKSDVLVCDGFSGNIALKSMEGTAKLVSHFLEREFRGSFYGRMAGLVALPVLRSLRRRLDPRRYNGASLVGLNGIVIKSHGGADTVALQQAIRVAMLEVEKNTPHQIRRLLESQDH